MVTGVRVTVGGDMSAIRKAESSSRASVVEVDGRWEL
jgi:hypothetical protein